MILVTSLFLVVDPKKKVKQRITIPDSGPIEPTPLIRDPVKFTYCTPEFVFRSGPIPDPGNYDPNSILTAKVEKIIVMPPQHSHASWKIKEKQRR